jgi:hypothetical protein
MSRDGYMTSILGILVKSAHRKFFTNTACCPDPWNRHHANRPGWRRPRHRRAGSEAGSGVKDSQARTVLSCLDKQTHQAA